MQSAQSGNTSALASLTGEQIAGDLLTAALWGWFAAAESHARLSQSSANMVEAPAMSYGLLHALVDPIYSWGVIRKVTFPGINIDIGHMRQIAWSRDNQESEWIAYNRLRGQYMSALEHAIPEKFFNDPSQCNPEGTATPNSSLPTCPQGVSAVKAIAVAAQAGQKIYTITREVYNNNPGIVSAKLSGHSEDTKQRIEQALDAGLEVTVHEAPVAISGWTGAGFTSIDPSTGAGAYTIEGGSSGGYKEHLTSEPGMRLLNFYGIGAPPTSYEAPLLIPLYSMVVLATYSAVNTVAEVIECYKDQIAETFLFILLVLAVAIVLGALTSGGGLGPAVAAVAALLATTTARAGKANQPDCVPPKMRLQLQASPRTSGTQTYNTQGWPLKGKVGIGVTTRQVRDEMLVMYDNRPSWFPGGVNLRELIVLMSECIKMYPPFGTSGSAREQICSPQQVLYNGLYYRLDLENTHGVNLKE